MTNAFAVLGNVLKERTLTEALRYLLDSNESHGLGSRVLRDLARRLGWKLPSQGLHATAVREFPLGDGSIIDVVVIVRRSWSERPVLALGIEAKIRAKESAAQIARYQEGLCSRFPNVDRRVLFLTLDGRKAETSDARLTRECPVDFTKWSLIADLAKEAGWRGVAKQFADYVAALSRLPSEDAQAAIRFVEQKVLPYSRNLLKLTKVEWRVDARYPDKTPREFNIEYDAHNPPSLKRKIRFRYMLYSREGVPTPGRQLHVLTMAFSRRKGYFNDNEIKQLDALKKKLPAPEGHAYQWGPWRCLWSAGCRTLRDMGEDDAEAVSRMLARAYLLTADSLLNVIPNFERSL